MTSRIIVFLISISFSALCSAQEFGGPDSKWVFNITGRYGPNIIEFDKDTLLDSVPYNKFIMTTQSFPDQGIGMRPLYLRNHQGLVTWSSEGVNSDTLFNLNAAPGDSWTTPHFRSFVDKNFVFNVVDTFTTTFTGKELKGLSYTVVPEGNFTPNFVDTIIEHIGFRHSFILPFDGFDSGGGWNIAGSLMCFQNDALGTIELDSPFFFGDLFPYDCGQLTSTEDDISLDFDIVLYPNPTKGRLDISGLDKGHQSYAIYDYSGRRMQVGELLGDTGLDVSALGSGVYFLRVGDRVRRFVKL